MDAIAKWGSTIIVLINTIFGVVGLFFILVGCMVKYAANKVDDLADSLISMAKNKIPDEASQYFDLDNLKLSEFVGEAYIAFIATGSVLMCIVIWAYCGTCCKSRWMLSIYALILTVIILGQVAVVVLLTTNRAVIDNSIKDAMTKTLTMYRGGFAKDAPSKAWNAIMGLIEITRVDFTCVKRGCILAPTLFGIFSLFLHYAFDSSTDGVYIHSTVTHTRHDDKLFNLARLRVKLHCCGVNGVYDFTSMTGWTRVVSVNTSGSPQNITMAAPFLCCANQSSTCPDQRHNDTNEYNGGCYDALWDLVDSNKSLAIGISSCLGVFEVLMWFLTVWLIKELGKSRKQVAPQ